MFDIEKMMDLVKLISTTYSTSKVPREQLMEVLAEFIRENAIPLDASTIIISYVKDSLDQIDHSRTEIQQRKEQMSSGVIISKGVFPKPMKFSQSSVVDKVYPFEYNFVEMTHDAIPKEIRRYKITNKDYQGLLGIEIKSNLPEFNLEYQLQASLDSDQSYLWNKVFENAGIKIKTSTIIKEPQKELLTKFAQEIQNPKTHLGSNPRIDQIMSIEFLKPEIKAIFYLIAFRTEKDYIKAILVFDEVDQAPNDEELTRELLKTIEEIETDIKKGTSVEKIADSFTYLNGLVFKLKYLLTREEVKRIDKINEYFYETSKNENITIKELDKEIGKIKPDEKSIAEKIAETEKQWEIEEKKKIEQEALKETQRQEKWKEEFDENLANRREAIRKAEEAKPITLEGKTFCFTGALETMKRPQAQDMVRNYGGVVKDSVVKGLNYLVTNDTSSGSVKNQKAREIGVTIINEQQFLDMINEINDNKSRAENPS